ncbi:MAG: 5-formyltetrahydrofolate cyclo-ligase [Lachnospiraceae bacterium]|nr:5-formyltetrahydrofolate cyclo-ligase [Lachnospiraceae bacterium]
MDKREIRKDLIDKRDAIKSDDWIEYSNKIQRNIIRSSLYRSAECILIYSDFHGEVGTFSLIEAALLDNKKVYLPKVCENFLEARMEFYRIYSTQELIDGFMGIKEPIGSLDRVFSLDEINLKKTVVFVPGVAFSKDNYRLGYGKGYYDNYLKDKEEMLKIGLCFSMQIKETIPNEEHDIKMNYVITEKTNVSEINKIDSLRI